MDETIKIYTADVALNPNTDFKPYLICYSETEGYLFINKPLFVTSFIDCIPIEDLEKQYDITIKNLKEFKEWM